MANRKSKIAKTATQALIILWEEGFLRSWRKIGAIEVHLAKRGNNFSGPELGMALKRTRHLTRRGKHGGYEYIQKYQFDPEDVSHTPSLRKTKRK
jgi:hypothetical protein